MFRSQSHHKLPHALPPYANSRQARPLGIRVNPAPPPATALCALLVTRQSLQILFLHEIADAFRPTGGALSHQQPSSRWARPPSQVLPIFPQPVNIEHAGFPATLVFSIAYFITCVHPGWGGVCDRLKSSCPRPPNWISSARRGGTPNVS